MNLQPPQPKLVLEDKHREYLTKLRDSRKTNMWGAGSYLAREFGLTQWESGRLLVLWIEEMSEKK